MVDEFQKYTEIRYFFGHTTIQNYGTYDTTDTMVSNMLLPQYFFKDNHIQMVFIWYPKKPWYMSKKHLVILWYFWVNMLKYYTYKEYGTTTVFRRWYHDILEMYHIKPCI